MSFLNFLNQSQGLPQGPGSPPLMGGAPTPDQSDPIMSLLSLLLSNAGAGSGTYIPNPQSMGNSESFLDQLSQMIGAESTRNRGTFGPFGGLGIFSPLLGPPDDGTPASGAMPDEDATGATRDMGAPALPPKLMFMLQALQQALANSPLASQK